MRHGHGHGHAGNASLPHASVFLFRRRICCDFGRYLSRRPRRHGDPGFLAARFVCLVSNLWPSSPGTPSTDVRCSLSTLAYFVYIVRIVCTGARMDGVPNAGKGVHPEAEPGRQ